MISAVDLFCGAGGTSTGILTAAAELGRPVDLLAINHWNVAIDTHTRNHPQVRHLCESLDNVDPRKAVPGRLNILAASPECTHHSIARGGKPCSDQSRAGAWHVVRWVEAARPDGFLVENVKEFRTWGPLGAKGRPMKSQKGRTFSAWLEALRSCGYTVDWRVVNCADYGDATTRERLFVMGRRRGALNWPAPSHIFNRRAAREIIDWSLKGTPLHERKRPLKPNTLRRIEAGLRRFGGEAFIVALRGTSQGHCQRSASAVDAPLPTVTAGGTHIGLAEPFVLNPSHSGRNSPRPVGEPLPTITTARAGELAIVEPFVIGQQSCAAPRPVSEPLPTIATAGAIALVEPFLVKYYGTGGAQPVSKPLDTVTTKPRFGPVEPCQVGIRFRMLQPHELAAAMSFPAGYQFAGNKAEQVKQIGNAVPVRTAAALVKGLL